jgi:outer membrane receptor protein involved in Fe transport
VLGAPDALDMDGDGNTAELRPMRDAQGLLVYGVDYGGVENLGNARLPLFARVDARLTWRPRGTMGRWELYAEVINVLNRRNAGALDARLEYDPNSDRPAIVEDRDQALPRLPTVGVRFRF